MAANYGLTFHCDPLDVLARDEFDLRAMQALLVAAHRLLDEADKRARSASNG